MKTVKFNLLSFFLLLLLLLLLSSFCHSIFLHLYLFVLLSFLLIFSIFPSFSRKIFIQIDFGRYLLTDVISKFLRIFVREIQKAHAVYYTYVKTVQFMYTSM
jgi:hypothetical protein